ncbi:hypothetical protein [Sulfobacillus sp. hq2]|uniref:hypothetical protein n=1 Tax=Sulfobacillus sp. hq2 TaxID=2039167 RepID=UPI000CD02D21|nr:hypothetical protein [Sulfobacillus sp. hq2]POB12163.1 hypothetical protein CO251_00625 [Sulfobacillus sp. hq2]
MHEPIIHRVCLLHGQPGTADSLSVSDLWEANTEAPAFFRAVLATLLSGRMYDDSDAPTFYSYYTTSDPDRLRRAVQMWYSATASLHSPEMAAWMADVCLESPKLGTFAEVNR